jgi:hypothetical protein
MRIGLFKVGFMKTDKYVTTSVNLLIVSGIERIVSAMEGINYSIKV